MFTEDGKKAYINEMIIKTSKAMRKQMLLPKNMEKGLWFTSRDMSDVEIIERIDQELNELKAVVYSFRYSSGEYKQKLIKEAADVCNFLGFLIDNQGGDI